jgi:hypothetical protein
MLAEQYAARAVELLAQAHEQGFFRNNPEAAAQFRRDPAFALLRGRPDFQRVLRAVEKRNAQSSGKAP